MVINEDVNNFSQEINILRIGFLQKLSLQILHNEEADKEHRGNNLVEKKLLVVIKLNLFKTKNGFNSTIRHSLLYY